MVARVLSFDDIDAALAEDKQEQQDAALFSAIKSAEGVNADQYAEALKVSDQTGISPNAAMRDPDLSKKLSQDDLLAIFDEVPEAKPWAEANAKLLDGDFSTLGRVKAAMDVTGQKIRNTGLAARRGVHQFNVGFYGTLENVAAMAEQAQMDKLAPFSPFAAATIGGRMARPYLTGLRKGEQAAADQQSKKIDANGGTGYIEEGIYSGISSLAGQLPATLLSVATGNPMPALTTAGVGTFGASATEAMDAGKDPYTAALYGGGNAAVEVGTEFLPIAKLIGDTKVGSSFFKTLVHQAATEVPGELTATTLQNLNQWAVMNPDKPFSTYLKQLPPDLGQTVIATLTSVGAQTGVVHGASRAARWRVTPEEAAGHIDGLNQIARSEPLAQRSPQAFKSLMQSINPDDNIYIDGQTALDMISSLGEEQQAQLFNALPELRTELETAAATGGDVKLNKADYTAYIAPHPQSDALRDFIKLDPEDVSIGEQAAMQKFLAENPEAAQMMQQQANELPLDATAEEMMPAIERVIRKSILDSGRGSVEARAVAPLFARSLARFAAPFGQNAVEALNSRLLQFQSVDADGNPIKVGSNINVILNDLDALQKGQRVAGLDDIGRAAVESFGGRLQNAGLTVEQARQLEPDYLLDVLYPRQQAQTIQVGDTEISLPQVDVGFDATGGLNIGIRQTKDDTGSQAERQYLEQRMQRDQDGDPSTPNISAIDGLPEGVPLKTDSPEFKDWFGDSKVVDEDGKPLVVYHGTTGDFYSFDPKKRGEATGAKSATMGFFFASDQNIASSYASNINPYEEMPLIRIVNKLTGGLYQKMNEGVLRLAGAGSAITSGANVMPVYLSIKNPLVVDFGGKEYREDTYADIIEKAQAGGHDGVILRNTFDEGFEDSGNPMTDVYVALQPNQIKSIFNKGSWSPETTNILYQNRNYGMEGTYSKLAKEIETLNLPNWKPKPKKALTPEEEARLAELKAKAPLDDNAEVGELIALSNKKRESIPTASGKEIWQKISKLPVKDEELKWSGIEDFLMSATEKLTRDEVLAFVNDNGVNIEVVTADEEAKEGEFRWQQERVDDTDYVDSRAEDLLSEFREDDAELSAAVEAITYNDRAYILQNYGGELSFNPDDFTDPDELTRKMLGDELLMEWVRDNFSDEIDSKLEEKAREQAQEEYDENPYYRWYDSETGFDITGNDDIGYTIEDANGRRHGGDIYSFNEAELQALELARDHGVLTDEDSAEVARWGDYTMRGRHDNYREVKLTLPDIEGDFENNIHFPDRNIVAFLRVDDRDLELPISGKALEDFKSANAQYSAEKEAYDKATDEAMVGITDEIPDDYFDAHGTWADFLAMQNAEIAKNQAEIERLRKEGETAPNQISDLEFYIQERQDRIESMREQWRGNSTMQRRFAARKAGLTEPKRPEEPRGDTKHTYFIDEFQSDWHQDGRQRGYQTGRDAGELEVEANKLADEIGKEVLAKVKAEGDETGNYTLRDLIATQSREFMASEETWNDKYTARILAQIANANTDESKSVIGQLKEKHGMAGILEKVDRWNILRENFQAERDGVPDAPFKGDNWISLGLKRAIIDAVENDYEALAWADSEVLVDRWSERYRELYATQYDRKMPSIVQKLTGIKPVKVEGEYDAADYWIIPITNELREKIKAEGLPLFQGERGSITFKGNTPADRLRNVVISFTEQANFSTAAHEFSHFAVATHRHFAELAREAIAKGETNPEVTRILEDWESLKEKLGTDRDDFGATQEERVKNEEKVADWFEAYLRTGAAPSEKLRRIFTRFRDWLTKIYKDLRELGGEPSKKVTEVFDRWLASEAEIAKVQEKNGAIAQVAQALGLPDDIITRISDYVASATANAEESLYRKLAAEEKKRQSKAYKEQFDRERKVVKEELLERKEYNLMAYMKDNGLKFMAGPETEGINPDVVSDNDGGVHPDVIADLYGYDNGLDMLRVLRSTPDIERAADRETRERLMDKYPDMIRSGRIVNEAVDSLYNDRTLLALDLMIKELGGPKIGMKQFAKSMAQAQVEKMMLSESNYGFRYEIAREKSLREALQAARSGKTQDALLKLQQAMVNQMIYKRLMEFRELRDKAEALFKRIDERDKNLAPTTDIDFIGAARYIMFKYGLGGENFDIQAWLDDVEQRNPDVMNDIIGLAQIITAPQKKAKELTIAEFRDIYNAVENIYDTARKMREFEKNGKKYRTEAILGDLLDKMGEVTKPLHEGTQIVGMGRVRNAFSTAKAAMRRVELWAKAMDGNGSGPFSKFIYDTVKQAENQYRSEKEKWLAGYLDIVKEHKDDLNKKGKIPTNMVKQDSQGRTARLTFKNKMELIGFLLHTGNESNLDKLLGGYGIDQSIYQAEMERLYANGTITDRDLDLVEKLWAYVESLKPVAQQAHKKLYGYRFDEIESKPYQLGERTMRGGYWPAIADVEQATNNKSVEQMLQETRQYMLATVGKGFTKNRVSGYRQPLKTDLRLGSQHIDKVLRFAHLEPAIRDVARLVNRTEFKDRLKAMDYDAFDGMLMPWLSRVATQTTELPANAGDRSARMGRAVLNFMKASAIAQIMYFNIVVPIQNFANMPVALRLTSLPSMARAWAKTTINPLGNIREMKKVSPFMTQRLSTNATRISQQLDAIAEKKGRYTRTKNYLNRNGFIFMLAFDSYLGTITWQAAYDDQYRKTQDDADAIRHADSVVRQVMGSGLPSDISKIEASHPLMKAIMPFYGYFNSQMNLITSEFGNIMREHGWRGSPKMFMAYISLVAAPAIIGDLIAKGLRGGLPGEDDDDDDDGLLDDWLAFATESQVKYLAAGVPLLTPLATAVLSLTGISTNNQQNRTNISPVVSGFETVVRTGNKLAKKAQGDDVDDARLLRDVMTSLGLVTGVPLGQVAKPLSYAVDVEQGNADSEPVDVLRGVLTGPPRK